MSVAVALRHAFPGFALDVAFEGAPGVTALFGRSGSGKTTIVNAVAGLMRPAQGRVVVDGAVLLDTARGVCAPPHRRRLGYVFQDGRLFPHLSVRGNLLYGRRAVGLGEGREVAHVIEMLGIGDLLARRPAGLSGGEKQRVAIGRALLSAPRALLMDEPLAALDDPRKAEILPYLERLRDETRIPILYVSHSVAEVARLATTVVVLESGRVARAGPADAVLSDPAAAPALGVRDAGAILRTAVAAHHPDGLSELRFSGGTLWLPQVAAPPGARFRVRIAARDVMIAIQRPEGLSALNVVPARVASLRQGEGPGVMARLQAGEDFLLARLTRRSADRLGLTPGMACYAVIKAVSVAPGDVGRPGDPPSP
jgi:molybdate transport system ATP-binding protein